MRIRNIMSSSFSKLRNGYIETINRGVSRVRDLRGGISRGSLSKEGSIARLANVLENADAVVIGAGAGLSTSAGFTYSGERFEKWFPDFIEKYGISDMYSGGFYPYPSKEIFWAFWARYIYINRYLDPPKRVYEDLLSLVSDKEYFVITTNVDHCFQKAGFDKDRLFYTQGDYGVFQSTDPRNRKTFDNEEWVMKAMAAQGFVRNAEGLFEMPKNGTVKTEIPTDLLPKHPDDGSEVTMNLRSDDSFVEDEGWHKAADAYAGFLDKYEGERVLFMEIGVGMNTPVIIKYPFWQMTCDNEDAFYACLNYDEAYCPEQIENRSVCIDGDSGEAIRDLLEKLYKRE